MEKDKFIEGERAMVIGIKGSIAFQNYLLANSISLGTIVTKNYSPTFAKLISITVAGKILSLRKPDFELLELVKI